jgi:hypothetical protein
VKLSAARRLALALPEVTEAPHHGMVSFRVASKIFCTVPDDDHLNVMLDAEPTGAAVETAPAAFAPLMWGKQLAGVKVTLAKAEPRRLAQLLELAWQRRAPKRLLAAPRR